MKTFWIALACLIFFYFSGEVRGDFGMALKVVIGIVFVVCCTDIHEKLRAVKNASPEQVRQLREQLKEKHKRIKTLKQARYELLNDTLEDWMKRAEEEKGKVVKHVVPALCRECETCWVRKEGDKGSFEDTGETISGYDPS